MPAPSIVIQTTYAELLERCATAAFDRAFPEDGAFTSKMVKGRRYWYFQTTTQQGRTQKYVGPETPELLEQIAHHKQARDDERERYALVSTLIRSFRLPRPVPQIGNIVAALANAGIFRLRAVLIGTVAYQTYPAMLGTKLPHGSLQTGDVDIAQFKNVSVAVEERAPPILNVLKTIDRKFRAVPHRIDGRRVTSYLGDGGVRVDFLTPNEGPDTETPQRLAALQTDAHPLRFLDFLIHDPEQAVVLHQAGINVTVPAPERYAVHKLIVSRRRPAGAAKADKDLQQADALLAVLVEQRPHELKRVWQEAFARGPSWRQLLAEAMSRLTPRTRDLTLKIVGQCRSMLPGHDLIFNDPEPRDDSSREVVTFAGQAFGARVSCAISREALEDHFGADGLDRAGRVRHFRQHRVMIEDIARAKYLNWPVEEPETILIRTTEVPKLLKESQRRSTRRNPVAST